jgi:hypothetical protein
LNTIYTLLLLLTTALLLTSCASVMYQPSAPPTGLYSADGQFDVAVHGGTSGVDLQVGRTLSDHVATFFGGSYLPPLFDSTVGHYEHLYGEAGIGYYFNPFVPYLHIMFSAGTGIGTGSAFQRRRKLFQLPGEEQPLELIDGLVAQVFTQATIGMSSNENLFGSNGTTEYGMAFRIGWIRWKDVIRAGDSLGNIESALIQPIFFYRTGSRTMQLEAQIGTTTEIGNRADDAGIDVAAFRASLGLHLKLHEFWEE